MHYGVFATGRLQVGGEGEGVQTKVMRDMIGERGRGGRPMGILG